MSGRRAGVFWIVLSAAGFGTMAIFARLAYGDGASLGTVLFLRFSLAGGLLALWGLHLGVRWPRGRDLALLAAMGGIGYVGQAYCYFSALRYASAGMVALLLYLYPAIVTVLSVLLGRQRIGGARMLAVAAALAGTALAVGGDLHSEPAGIALGIGAALIYSIYILIGEGVMARVSPMAATTVVVLSAAMAYGAASASAGFAWPQTFTGWASVLAIAVFSTLLAILGFFKGLEKLGAADASALSTLEPLVTVVLAAVVLGESATVAQLAGGGLILTAVVYLARRPPARIGSVMGAGQQ
jgi:drug/metabolite transporter (DMT)-like permease